MNARERILGRISDRGGERQAGRAASAFVPGDLWKQFAERLEQLGGRIIGAPEFVGLQTRLTWVEPAISKRFNIQSLATDIWEAEVGFSLAEFAVAETGTLVLSARPGCERLSSLVPPVNVVTVPRVQIVATLTLAMARLPERNAVLVTGPSRTADIEGVLVRGIHGPGELLVYIDG